MVFSTIQMSSPHWKQGLKIFLADIYIKEGPPKRARELLQDIDGTLLDAQQTGNMLCVLGDLHRLSHLDTAAMVQELFQGIVKLIPSEKTAQNREKVFLQTAALAFHLQTWREEQLESNFCRPSYTLFLPLGIENEFGLASIILETKIHKSSNNCF